MSDTLIRAENITKSFPGTVALKGVDFSLKKGEVHALIGENGAGKSTLVKILSGVHQKDSGVIYYDESQIEFLNPKAAQDWGISIIFQELNLFQHLTVAQNIFIGREKMKGFFLDEKAQNTEALKILKLLNSEDIDPGARVSTLTVSKQQIVEIAKSLSMNTKVLIMDEPTSALTEKEIDNLFKIIHQLKNNGVGIIYISHRLEELKHIVDRVSIYRDGEYIATKAFSVKDLDEYIQLMVGRRLDEKFPYVEPCRGEKILEVKNVNRGNVLKNVSFDLYSGEILAFSGLAGAGRTELARAIFGADSVDTMEVYKNGKKLEIKSVKDAIKNGIGYLPEDRKKHGLALGLSVVNNLTIATLNNFTYTLGFINTKKEIKKGNEIVDSLCIKTPSIYQLVCNLSGGNQQKVVVGKWMLKNLDILIVDEPTRGIDVGAKIEIYNILNELKKKGKAIIVISSELPEVLGISDRILVMCNGEVKAVINAKETDQKEIMNYATKFNKGVS